ncbi:TIGR03089 family protein [Micromonospora sp. NBRC 101691]|uniref:TIGR03089 family protein n=1 Tax=Micromonospora sp. NBRC 101691 TaxID=3032198 RepID=UPI0024A4B16B|nr:TIGR03089 family protein [Micromonospora sp. NBRC 101691]GLY22148.1 TIGR03089 family protein [Micromonospora sp. NBRC 101691]
MTTSTADLPDLLVAGAVTGADAPLLTFYDDATGERTALSAAQLGGWAARTTGLLRDGCGLGPGSRAAVLLPPHWQTAAVLLGAWAAGVSVSFRGWATAGLPRFGPGADEPLDASFVARHRVDNWLDNPPEATHRFVLGLGPVGVPPAEPPAGYRDFLTEVGRYPDSLPPYAAVRRSDAASVDGTSYRQWGEVARGVAEACGLRRGDRILVDAATHEEPVTWLLAPLAVGASVVVCADLDPDRVDERIAAEQITRVL